MDNIDGKVSCNDFDSLKDVHRNCEPFMQILDEIGTFSYNILEAWV